jgi:threonine aldolase
MRQAGVVAAPGIVALETMIDRLEEDHENAKFLACGISKIQGLNVDMERVQTNMVLIDTSGLGVEDSVFVSALKNQALLVSAIGKNRVRLVTHRGIERQDVMDALAIIDQVVGRLQHREL